MIAVSKVCRRSFGTFRLTWPARVSRIARSCPPACPYAPRCARSAGAAQPVRLGVEHRVQRLLDRAANHLAEVIPDPRLVDLDHLAHRPRLWLLVHLMLLSAILKGAASPGKCAKDSVRYHAVRRRQHVVRDPHAERTLQRAGRCCLTRIRAKSGR